MICDQIRALRAGSFLAFQWILVGLILLIVVTNSNKLKKSVHEKDWTVTLILAVFFGHFGIDRFYTGHVGFGILKLLTGGGLGIWWLIDIILILTDNYKDRDGKPLVKR